MSLQNATGSDVESLSEGLFCIYFAIWKVGSGKKVKVARDYRNFVYSNNIGGADWWIDPFLERIFALCERDGTSRYWLSAYHKGD